MILLLSSFFSFFSVCSYVFASIFAVVEVSDKTERKKERKLEAQEHEEEQAVLCGGEVWNFFLRIGFFSLSIERERDGRGGNEM